LLFVAFGIRYCLPAVSTNSL